MNNLILECKNLNKYYKQATENLLVLDNINFSVKLGETVSIMGSSGSGKSTLLHILAGLDTKITGEVFINDILINKLSNKHLCKLRNSYTGFIYQFHHLLPEFSALENVLIPLFISNVSINKTMKDKAIYLLEKLGIYNRHSHYPSQLSGGERQRVAIARAMINDPQLIFADEPTGNLDNQTSKQVLNQFLKLQEEFKTSLIIVTHNLEIANSTTTKYKLLDNKLTLLENI